MNFRRKRPDRIEIAYPENIADADAYLCIKKVAISYFGFDQFAQMEPPDTGNEIEEYAMTVPFGLQRYVFVGEQLPSMQECEAVRIVGIALVRRGLPEKSVRYRSEESTSLERIGECAAHAEIRVLGKHDTQVGVKTVGPMAGFEP